MSLRNKIIGAFAVVMAAGMFSSTARADGWENGFWMYPYQTYLHDTIGGRPMNGGFKTLSIHDTSITNTPINHKGIGIGATRLPNGQYWAWNWVAIWHCEISGIWRTPGWHTDFIQIVGGGNWQDQPTDVILQDIDLHDGVGIPVMIEDGNFNNILMKDLRVRNTGVSLQVTAIHTGHINTITVDHCPNMSIAIMGRPGAIGQVFVKNSPGLRISDTPNVAGRSGARVIFLN